MSDFEIVGKGQYPSDHRDHWTEEVIETNTGKVTVKSNRRELSLSEKAVLRIESLLEPPPSLSGFIVHVLVVYTAGAIYVRIAHVIVALFGITGIILTLIPTIVGASLLLAGLSKRQFRLPLIWRTLLFLLGGI